MKEIFQINSNPPVLIKLNDNKTLYDKCKQDYDNIQKCLNDTNEIRSKVGEYIQCRTKGQNNSKSRAYYFKTQYIRECITLICEVYKHITLICEVYKHITPKILYTDNIKELIKQVS